MLSQAGYQPVAIVSSVRVDLIALLTESRGNLRSKDGRAKATDTPAKSDKNRSLVIVKGLCSSRGVANDRTRASDFDMRARAGEGE